MKPWYHLWWWKMWFSSGVLTPQSTAQCQSTAPWRQVRSPVASPASPGVNSACAVQRPGWACQDCSGLEWTGQAKPSRWTACPDHSWTGVNCPCIFSCTDPGLGSRNVEYHWFRGQKHFSKSKLEIFIHVFCYHIFLKFLKCMMMLILESMMRMSD